MSGDFVPRKAGAAIAVTPVMLHDLANHLTIALGNADLLVLEAGEAASRPEVTEIRDACRRAVDLVNQWRARLAEDPGPNGDDITHDAG